MADRLDKLQKLAAEGNQLEARLRQFRDRLIGTDADKNGVPLMPERLTVQERLDGAIDDIGDIFLRLERLIETLDGFA